MSKCDTMKVGEVLLFTNLETEERITVRVNDIERGRVELGAEAAKVWKITRLPAGCGDGNH